MRGGVKRSSLEFWERQSSTEDSGGRVEGSRAVASCLEFGTWVRVLGVGRFVMGAQPEAQGVCQ